jgi:hypothetical protein
MDFDVWDWWRFLHNRSLLLVHKTRVYWHQRKACTTTLHQVNIVPVIRS